MKNTDSHRDAYLCPVEQVPYKKMIRVSLIVAVAFGLIMATPSLLISKESFRKIPAGFASATGGVLLLSAINIALIRLTLLYRQSFPAGRRIVVSILCTGLLTAVVFIVLLQTGMIDRTMDNLPAPVKALRPKPALMFVFPLIQAQAMNLVVFILLEMVLLRDNKQRIETENNQLRLANLEARNNQLQQQMHPHFLFNSLSTLRSLIGRNAEQAEDYLVKLSELLRFSINNNAQTTVKLQEEINLCANYLSMQQVRFGDALHFTIDVPLQMLQQFSVPVYSIQLLIENAIKHNILTREQPLYIFVSGNPQQHTITVNNNLQIRQSLKPISGIGLANLAERYQLLGSKTIDIQQHDNNFAVTIQALTI